MTLKITPANQHFLALSRGMLDGFSASPGKLLACMDFAVQRVPCAMDDGGVDLVATLLLGRHWEVQNTHHNLRLLTHYARHNWFNETTRIVTDVLPYMSLPQDSVAARWPLTAAMQFAGPEATAVLVEHGILKYCDVGAMLDAVVASDFVAAEDRAQYRDATQMDAFGHLIDIAMLSDRAGKALVMQALMRFRIAESAQKSFGNKAAGNRVLGESGVSLRSKRSV